MEELPRVKVISSRPLNRPQTLQMLSKYLRAERARQIQLPEEANNSANNFDTVVMRNLQGIYDTVQGLTPQQQQHAETKNTSNKSSNLQESSPSPKEDEDNGTVATTSKKEKQKKEKKSTSSDKKRNKENNDSTKPKKKKVKTKK